MYGGNTQTFKHNKKPVMKKMNDERLDASFPLPHFDMRRTMRMTSGLYDIRSPTTKTRRKPSGCCGGGSIFASKPKNDVEIFYAWECVSFIRKDGTTFDIVVKDMHEILCLIHIVHKQVTELEA